MQRRFAQISARDQVEEYEAGANAAGRPTLFELAKKDAATRTEAEVDAMDQFIQLMRANPEAMKQVLGETFGKLMKDLSEK
jgi:predicted ArsR family transcriptional regulator